MNNTYLHQLLRECTPYTPDVSAAEATVEKGSKSQLHNCGNRVGQQLAGKGTAQEPRGGIAFHSPDRVRSAAVGTAHSDEARGRPTRVSDGHDAARQEATPCVYVTLGECVTRRLN